MSNELGCDLPSMQTLRSPGNHVKISGIREEISPTISAGGTYVKLTVREERTWTPFLNTSVDGEAKGVGAEGVEALSLEGPTGKGRAPGRSQYRKE